ncbi:hypothetical protein LINPERHAP1_LOCUS34667 [Linum perenne]
MPFAYRTVAVGRKLLEPKGEVVRIGCLDAHKPEGCYVKGRVRKDLFSPFLGTAPVNGEDGSSFQVFFQYEGVPCICYLCGFLGHVMGDCFHTELVFDPLIWDSWICGVTDPDEVETERPSFRRLIPSRPQAPPLGGPSVLGLGPNANIESDVLTPQVLPTEERRKNWTGPEPRPTLVKQVEIPADPSDKMKPLGPHPIIAASSPLGSGPLQALQGAAVLRAEPNPEAC